MTNLSTYGAYELAQTVADDPWSVRDESARRMGAMAKRWAAANAQAARLAAECAEMERIYNAALAQIRAEQAA